MVWVFYLPSELLLTRSFATDYFTHVVQVIEGSRRRASRCYVPQCCIYRPTGWKRQGCSSSSQSWERYRLRCMRGGFFVYSIPIAVKSNQFPWGRVNSQNCWDNQIGAHVTGGARTCMEGMSLQQYKMCLTVIKFGMSNFLIGTQMLVCCSWNGIMVAAIW